MAARKNNTVVGALMVIFASACVAGFSLFVQMASRHADEFVIIWISYVVSALILLPLLLVRGPTFMASTHWRLLTVRGSIGVIQIAVFFIALQTISLVDGVLLRDAAPLFVPILLWLFWKEHVPRRLWLGIVIGFVGVALILHPNYARFEAGYLYGLASGILYAWQSILSRRVNLEGEPILRTLCYIFAAGIVLFAIPAFLQWQPLPTETWIHLVFVGVLLVAGSALLLLGLQYAPAYVLAPLGYTAVLFSAALDWWVFGLVPHGLTILGGVIVVASSILIIQLSRSAGVRDDSL